MSVTSRLMLPLVGILATVRFISAACDPTVDPDRTDVVTARAAVTATCDCNADRRTYMRCATDTADATLVNESCGPIVRRCARRSTCGRPGFVTCCRTSRSGRTRCALKRTAGRCVPPPGGSACTGSFPSCCDACDSSGCVTTSTTSTSTSSTTSTSVPVPCAPDGAGGCVGTCTDFLDTCGTDPTTGQCGCFLPCGVHGGIGSCGGVCPPPALCGFDANLFCRCIVPCHGTDPQTCGGECAPGQGCTFDVAASTCRCVPLVPCASSGPPFCGGACPAGQACVYDGGTGVCVCG